MQNETRLFCTTANSESPEMRSFGRRSPFWQKQKPSFEGGAVCDEPRDVRGRFSHKLHKFRMKATCKVGLCGRIDMSLVE